MLNQATIDELGLEKGGLRNIASLPDQRNLYNALVKENFKPAFICMTEKDEQSLEANKLLFKE